jgi:hypothetical protein
MTKRSKAIPPQLLAAYRYVLGQVGARPDVTGVDIGFKYKDGARRRQLVVRVHVAKKVSLKRLPASQHIPKAVSGAKTDVVEASYRSHALSGSAASVPGARLDPLCCGVSVGNPKAGVGTLGAIVFDDATGEPCLLSAFHVLAGPLAVDRDFVTQPARFDQGTIANDTVARLLRSLLPGTSGDAAVARFTNARTLSREQRTSGVVVRRAVLPIMGQVLEKSGRTTGVTRGVVDGMGRYFYAEAPGGISGFRLAPHGPDDPACEDLSAPGDSGAVWYDPATEAGVGLHAGGEVAQTSEFAVASYLTRVLSALQVRL